MFWYRKSNLWPRRCGRSECRSSTLYRWSNEYGCLKTNQVKRLKELEKENERLRKFVSDLTLENLILRGRLGNRRPSSMKLLSPARRDRCVDQVMRKFNVPERFACHVLGQYQSTQNNVLRRRHDVEAHTPDKAK